MILLNSLTTDQYHYCLLSQKYLKKIIYKQLYCLSSDLYFVYHIFYINDFPNVSRLFNFIMYADDTTLSCTIPRSVKPNENFEFECMLNKELFGIDEWLKVNKLSLNVEKSKYMLFKAGNKRLYPFEIKIDDISIERVYVFNFLGLIMDEHLNWKSC